MNKTIITLLSCAVLALPAVASDSVSELSAKQQIAKRQAQLTYSRALEATMWAAPAVAVLSQIQANHRDLGANNGDIVYTKSFMDHRWGGITYNNQSPYWLAEVSVKDEPMVVEIPPVSDKARFFGSIHDVWWLPLEDFGPAGADEGNGGKYLVVGPDYQGEIPTGYIVLRSSSNTNFVPGRTIVRDKGGKGWNDGVEYIKQAKIYPLSQAVNPPKQRFVDGTAGQVYNAQPQYNISDFNIINQLIQQEPQAIKDKIMYGMLSEIGIEKGKEFKPTTEQIEIFEGAAKDAQAYAIAHIKSGESFHPFWKNSAWGSFKVYPHVAKTLLSYDFGTHIDYETRFHNVFYFSGGMYKRFDATKPSSTAYLMTAIDNNGDTIDVNKTYKFTVPANVPTKYFWSIIAYGAKSRTFINSPKFTLSSNNTKMMVNSDGSTDIYLATKPVKGFEVNTLIINPNEDYFLMFRLYGATPELWQRKWQLGSPTLAN